MDDKSDRKDAPPRGLTNAVKGGLARAPASAPKVQVVPRQTNESDGDLAAEHHAGPHSLPQAHVDFAPAKAVIVDVEASPAEEEPRRRRAIATQIIPMEALAAAAKRPEPTRWPYVVGIVVVLAAMGWFVTRRPLEENARSTKEQAESHGAPKASSRVLANPAVATAVPPSPSVLTAAAPSSNAPRAVLDPSKSVTPSSTSTAAASIGSLPVQGASKDLKFLEPKK